jgi:hypothetical protein
LNQAATIQAPGTAGTDGQRILLRIIDNGTARTLSFTAYTPIGLTLPTTTVAGKYVYIGIVYNAGFSGGRWEIISVAQE